MDRMQIDLHKIKNKHVYHRSVTLNEQMHFKLIQFCQFKLHSKAELNDLNIQDKQTKCK